MLLYAYVSGNPLAMIDPLGLWGLGEWWNNTCEGVKGLFIGTSDMNHWNKARESATANSAAMNEQLVAEGKMTPEKAEQLKAGLKDVIAAEQASDVVVTEKRLDFVETGALLVPVVGPAISAAATATNAGISVAQGNYSQAMLGLAPGVGGQVAAKAAPNLLTPLLKNTADDLASATARSGGRLGNQSTRQLNAEIAENLERRGFEITHGGGRGPEAFLRGAGPGTKGGNFTDITAVRGNHRLHVNTISTLADGATPIAYEAAAAASIRSKLNPFEHLLMIPKKK